MIKISNYILYRNIDLPLGYVMLISFGKLNKYIQIVQRKKLSKINFIINIAFLTTLIILNLLNFIFRAN
jgi:hypothetical protein